MKNRSNGDHDPPHTYLSTACYHGHHDMCRRICKYCPALCLCKCHGLYPTMHEGVGIRPKSAAELGEPIGPPPEPLS